MREIVHICTRKHKQKCIIQKTGKQLKYPLMSTQIKQFRDIHKWNFSIINQKRYMHVCTQITENTALTGPFSSLFYLSHLFKKQKTTFSWASCHHLYHLLCFHFAKTSLMTFYISNFQFLSFYFSLTHPSQALSLTFH